MSLLVILEMFVDRRTAALMAIDKAGALKKTAEAQLRKLELSAGAGNAAVMSEATCSYDQVSFHRSSQNLQSLRSAQKHEPLLRSFLKPIGWSARNSICSWNGAKRSSSTWSTFMKMRRQTWTASVTS